MTSMYDRHPLGCKGNKLSGLSIRYRVSADQDRTGNPFYVRAGASISSADAKSANICRDVNAGESRLAFAFSDDEFETLDTREVSAFSHAPDDKGHHKK